jgi:hypothetical protein
MTQSSKRMYRILVTALLVVIVGVLAVIGVVLALNRPPSEEAVALTLTALPTAVPTLTLTPTPVPTVPGVTEELLICQREASWAMRERDMVGAVNISDDHRFLLDWLSLDWEIKGLDDAIPGVIMGFDVALDLWEEGCAVYDRVQIDAYDRRGEMQVRRLTVQAQMDDLLRWRAGEMSDSALLARLEVTPAVVESQ